MKPRNSAPGIYYYKNKINGKLYIGQAQNLHKRHSTFGRGKYCGGIFDNAIKKYGKENFEYGILTHCKVEELDKWEQFYIKRLKTKSPNGYNLTEGGNSSSYAYVVVQCDRLNHNKVLNIFPSLSEAQMCTGIYSIHKCVNGYQQNSGGYFWRKAKDNEIPYVKYNSEYLKKLDNNKKLTAQQKKQLKESGVWKHQERMKTVYCFNPKGEIIDICESTKETGKKYGVCYHTITDICNGLRKDKYLNNITFSYNKSHKVEPFFETKIYQYTLDGELVNTYDSLKEASEATGAMESSISSCICGHYKTSMGFVWKRETKEITQK